VENEGKECVCGGGERAEDAAVRRCCCWSTCGSEARDCAGVSMPNGARNLDKCARDKVLGPERHETSLCLFMSAYCAMLLYF